MPVSLSIKHVPDQVVDRLRQRAAHNKRSLQCELLHIVEQAAGAPPKMSVDELYARAKALGLPPSKPGESARLIRRMRDERTRHLMKLIDKPRGRR